MQPELREDVEDRWVLCASWFLVWPSTGTTKVGGVSPWTAPGSLMEHRGDGQPNRESRGSASHLLCPYAGLVTQACYLKKRWTGGVVPNGLGLLLGCDAKNADLKGMALLPLLSPALQADDELQRGGACPHCFPHFHSHITKGGFFAQPHLAHHSLPSSPSTYSLTTLLSEEKGEEGVKRGCIR